MEVFFLQLVFTAALTRMNYSNGGKGEIFKLRHEVEPFSQKRPRVAKSAQVGA